MYDTGRVERRFFPMLSPGEFSKFIATLMVKRHVRSNVKLVLAKEGPMLYYAAIFLVIALIAGLFGFTGIAAGAIGVAKVLCFIFLLIFVVTLLLGLVRR